MDAQLEGAPRTYRIRRSHHLGYGFVVGFEYPTMVKIVVPEGPSFKRLLTGDIIMAVNGIDVEDSPREQITKMIQLCDDEIEIKVRQPSYEEMIRARNLADPRFYTLNKMDSQRIQTTKMPSKQQVPQLPYKRSVTPISQEQNFSQLEMHNRRESQNSTAHNSSSSSMSQNTHESLAAKSIPDNVLRQNFNNGRRQDFNNNLAAFEAKNNTLGRSLGKYGRHSPVPQRCKSSMDGTQTLKPSKKKNDLDNEPRLKRSNTMRPMRPSAKVMEIFQVITKIFFETGHTRVLKYDQDTTVATILESLNARITGPHAEEVKKYFGLALTVGVNPDKNSAELSSKRNWLVVLGADDSIMKIRKLWYAKSLRFFYRMVNPPADVYELYCQDKVAFDYLYQQSLNDLKLERFDPELDHGIVLKLSALRLLEYVYSNHSKAHGNGAEPKLYIGLIKKEPGLQYFLPKSTVDSLVDRRDKPKAVYKKLKAKLTEQIRRNFAEFDLEPPKARLSTNGNRYSSTSFHELCLPEHQSSPSDHIKLVFLNYLSQLPCYDNLRRPKRTQESPLENGSACELSDSIDSTQRTSDSSPLLKQERTQHPPNGNNRSVEPVTGNMSRLAQMNSMRSLNSIQTATSVCQPSDRPDVDSIDSVSSITFNMHTSDSPQPTPSHPLQTEVISTHDSLMGLNMQEPMPMPRQQNLISKTKENNSLEGLYNQRYTHTEKPFEEMLRNAILLPPPPPIANMMFDDLPFHIASRNIDIRSANSLTQVLSDQDLEELKVPPPPRVFN